MAEERSEQGINEKVRERLVEYRKARNLSCAELAVELGKSRGYGSNVNKYLNAVVDTYDVAGLEAAAEDVLRNAQSRRENEIELQDIYPAIQAAGALEIISRTSDIGLIVGPAGIGKTCGLELYVKRHPTATLVTLSRWTGGASGVERAVFEAIDPSRWPKNISRSQWLVNRFRASKRLMIFDNAQRLTQGGREWIFDFVDATGISVALCGNPDILAAIRTNDQQFSRIGMIVHIQLGDVRELTTAMLKQGGRVGSEAIFDLAERVIQEHGHCRALRKRLSLTHELIPETRDIRKAFLKAHTMQVADYKLA
jgi:DNA transposition AAA+ family ATPase